MNGFYDYALHYVVYTIFFFMIIMSIQGLVIMVKGFMKWVKSKWQKHKESKNQDNIEIE